MAVSISANGSDGLRSDPDLVLNQYDNKEAAQFYSIVMGDGSADIHYGIFESPDDSTLMASSNTVSTLMKLLLSSGARLDHTIRVLDLGAGNGGSAHKVVRNTGAHVTCVNLCESQNVANEREVARLGLAAKIDVITASFDDLPQDWTDRFDVVWSQDAFCHGQDKHKLLAEVQRVMKMGGHLVFSDIMAGPAASPKALDAFKKRLHAEELLTLADYEQRLQDNGLRVLRTRDLTGHLVPNYRRMVSRATTERHRMTAVTDQYLKDYTALLRDNIDVLMRGEAQCWSAVVARKDGPVNGLDKGMAVDKDVADLALNNPNGGMMKRYVTTKLHNLTVTDKSVAYHGSISVCRKILEAGGVEEYESVDVVNLSNGSRWTTYAIANDTQGAFTLNGGGARLGEVGDQCVVMTYAMSAKFERAKVVYCDGTNKNAIADEFFYEQKLGCQ